VEESQGKLDVQNQPKGNGNGEVDSVKQRFRERMAARMRQTPSGVTDNEPSRSQQPTSYFGSTSRHGLSGRPMKANTSPAGSPNILSLAGEEMFQHLDFYERSLKAVESQRGAK
jgi:hypothetical protein